MRRFLITVHLALAALLMPVLLLMAISGALELFDEDGKADYSTVATLEGEALDKKSPTLKADVEALLAKAGKSHDFEYVKARRGKFYTRPTSEPFYELKNKDGAVEIRYGVPNFQMQLTELHRGRGPGNFVWLQKIFTFCLILIAVSGFFVGLMSPVYRMRTIGFALVGSAIFAGLLVV